MGMEDRDWYREEYARKHGRKAAHEGSRKAPEPGQTIGDFLKTERAKQAAPLTDIKQDTEALIAVHDKLRASAKGGPDGPAGDRPQAVRPTNKSIALGVFVFLAAVAGSGYYFGKQSGATPGFDQDDSSPSLLGKIAAYSKRATSAATTQPMLNDPHGNPWPETTGYLVGTPVLNADGKNTFRISNPTGERYLLHLVDIDQSPNVVVRQLYLEGTGDFVMQSLTPGRYVVRRVKIRTGEAEEIKTVFTLETKPVAGGLLHTNAGLVMNVPHGAIGSEPVDLEKITGQRLRYQ